MKLKKLLKNKETLESKLAKLNKEIASLNTKNGFQECSFVALRTAKKKVIKLEDWAFYSFLKNKEMINVKEARDQDMFDVTGVHRSEDSRNYMISESGILIPKSVLKFN